MIVLAVSKNKYRCLIFFAYFSKKNTFFFRNIEKSIEKNKDVFLKISKNKIKIFFTFIISKTKYRKQNLYSRGCCLKIFFLVKFVRGGASVIRVCVCDCLKQFCF